MCIVVEGVVLVSLSNNSSNAPGFEPDAVNGNKISNSFKIVGPGNHLNSTSQLLECLSSEMTHSRKADTVSPTFGELKATYQARTPVKVVRLLLRKHGHIPKEVYSPIVQALMKKLYSITFRYARSHFGLDSDVFDCEHKFNTIKQTAPRNLNSTSSSFPPGNSADETLYRSSEHPLELIHGERVASSDTASTSNLSPAAPSKKCHLQQALRQRKSLNRADLSKSRKDPILHLQTGHNDKKSAGATTIISPSILSQTERKEKKFAKFEPKSLDTSSLKSTAMDAILHILGLVADGGAESPDQCTANEQVRSELASKIEIVSLEKGAYLAHANERHPGLSFVLEGELLASLPPYPVWKSRICKDIIGNDKLVPKHVLPGSLVGYSCLLANNRSVLDWQASKQTVVAILPRTSVRKLSELDPRYLLVMAGRMATLLSPLLSLMDFATEWSLVNAGDHVYKEGDERYELNDVLASRSPKLFVNH